MNKHPSWLHTVLSVALLACETLLAESARNPIIHADVPDNAIIRTGDTYYMSSTTMHMSPGLPIMKSKNLVNWEMVGYVYDTLVNNDALTLQKGKNAYGAGSWASSFRFHSNTFYVSTFSATSGKTHVYTTKDVEKGSWKVTAFEPSLHDHSLFFDDDGRVYMIYGGGTIKLIELASDVSGIKPGGVDRVIIPNASLVAGPQVGLNAEGSQMWKIKGKYYLFNVTWPRNDMRTEIVHRADKITGPYEGRIFLKDRGIAQGGLIDTPDGKWYAHLFQDHGAVGRIPYLMPVTWEDGWPVVAGDGKVPDTLDIQSSKNNLLASGIVASDEFNRKPGDPSLPLAWQWNHNPDNASWSLTARPGALRLTTGRVDAEVVQARNTLTQRTFGPESSAMTAMDVSNMKDGDYAGLIALQKIYGFVGVKMENRAKSIIMVSAESKSPVELASVPLNQKTLYLKIDCDFKNRADLAYFCYSFDGVRWTGIGKPLKMVYTLPHFMGYRFGLFNFATKTAGGYVDYDYFRVSTHAQTGSITNEVMDRIRIEPDIPYAGNSNTRQRLDLYLPQSPMSKKPLPLVVFIHGGAFIFGDRKLDPAPGDPNGLRLVLSLVASGKYAGASVGYRLSNEAKWPAQIHDCKAAIRWLKGNSEKYGIDPNRIGVMGTSAGGHLSAFIGTSGGTSTMEGDLGGFSGASSQVACVVDQYGPTDFLVLHGENNRSLDTPAAQLIGGALPDHLDATRSASPLTYVSTTNPPFLIIHGTNDGFVNFKQSELLYAALRKKGVDATLLPVTGGGHGNFPAQGVSERITAFLDKHLLK